MNSRCACDMGSLEKARDSPHYGIVAENRLTELEKRQQALDVLGLVAGPARAAAGGACWKVIEAA